MAKPSLKEISQPAQSGEGETSRDMIRKLTEINRHLMAASARTRDMAALADFARAFLNAERTSSGSYSHRSHRIQEIDALRFIHRTAETISDNCWSEIDGAKELTHSFLALLGAEKPDISELDDI